MSFETVELDALRRRRSEKWHKFPPDVLPSHIAEMDFAVAPPIEETLVAVVRSGDLGYAHARSSGLPEAFAGFAPGRGVPILRTTWPSSMAMLTGLPPLPS